ncbi:type IV pilus assembly protein FimV [Andreprevotia chitinilytica]|uniref:type IV pilus assembly protein FimV n=1 Tax=Andreprevotia chitinilytica TaxID=396808 RepID=UPI000550D832|nr:hypothetical protein [Andreprevotia chitinilytica]
MPKHARFHVHPARVLLFGPLLMLGSTVSAMNLGELQLHSFVGQRLRADIPFRVADGETLNDECISLVSSNATDLPGIGVATLRVKGNVLELRSQESVAEPTSAFIVRVDCGKEIFERDYVLMLDPAPVIESATIAGDTTRPATTSSLPATTSPRKHRHAAPAGAQTAGNAVGEKAKTRAERRAEQAAERDILRIEGGGPLPAPAPLQQGSTAYTKDLENRVATLQALQVKLESDIAELQHTLKALKSQTPGNQPGNQNQEPQTISLGHLQGVGSLPAVASQTAATLATSAAASAAATAPVIKPVAVVTPIPVVTADTVPARPIEKSTGWPIWPFILVILGLCGGLFLWWWQRRGSSTEFADTLGIDTQLNSPPSLSATLQRKLTLASGFVNSQLAVGSIEVQEETQDVDERAQMLMVQGDVTAAIEELQRGIEENPHDVERWFLLFRIFRHQGMKNDYAHLARRFKTIHTGDDDWELVRNIGHRLDPENPLYTEEIRTQQAQDDADLELIAPLRDAAAAATAAEKAATPVMHEPPLDFLAQKTKPGEERADSAPPPKLELELPPLDQDLIDESRSARTNDPLIDEVELDLKPTKIRRPRKA